MKQGRDDKSGFSHTDYLQSKHHGRQTCHSWRLQVAQIAIQKPKLVLSTANVSKIQNLIDWGEAPDVSQFQGRHPELALLHQWLVADPCRLVAVPPLWGTG